MGRVVGQTSDFHVNSTQVPEHQHHPVGMFADLGAFYSFWLEWRRAGGQTLAALCRSGDGKSITRTSKLRRQRFAGGKSQCAIRGNLSSLMATPGSPGGPLEASVLPKEGLKFLGKPFFALSQFINSYSTCRA